LWDSAEARRAWQEQGRDLAIRAQDEFGTDDWEVFSKLGGRMHRVHPPGSWPVTTWEQELLGYPPRDATATPTDSPRRAWRIRQQATRRRRDEFRRADQSATGIETNRRCRSVRKIVVYELLSLDGVAEGPDSFITDWDEAMDANLAAVIAAQDAVILGRRSYTEWAEFWPGSQIQPFAAFINGVTKYVATSTPLDQDWAGATAIDGGLAEFVRELRQQDGGDVGVHASISVAQALLAAGLVDELRLVIAPRIAGRGRRLLDGLPSIQLESIRSELSPTGYLLADYRVIR
jgi:dihydrofolate reductase